MVGLCLGLAVAELTPLFTATCFSIIANDLHAMKHMVWITVSSYVAEGAVAPFVGSLSDMFGRRGIVLFSLVVKILACILMGSSYTLAPYLVGSVLSGISVGILIMTVIAGVTELVPAAKRGAMLGYIVIGLIPFGPGAFYGQLIASHDWRYIYLLIGILTLISLVCLAIWYHPPPRETAVGLTKKEMLGRIDWGGGFLSVLGFTLLIIGINWGGIDYPWRSKQVISTLTLGLFILVLFVCYERWVTKWPMFQMRMAKNKRMLAACVLICFASGVNYVPVTTFWGIQVYAVYGGTWTQAGVWMIPTGLCIFGGAIVGAISLTVFKRHIQWVLLTFCIIQTVGKFTIAGLCIYASMHRLTDIFSGSATASLFDRNNINSIWAQLVLALIGVGGVLLPNQVVFTVIAPDDLIGSSVALAVVVRILGQVVGKSAFFNIFSEKLKAEGPALIGIPAISVGIPPSVERITVLVESFMAGPFSKSLHLFPELDTPQKVEYITNAAHELYAKVLTHIYLMSLPWGLVACVGCLGLFGISKYMDNHVAVHL